MRLSGPLQYLVGVNSQRRENQLLSAVVGSLSVLSLAAGKKRWGAITILMPSRTFLLKNGLGDGFQEVKSLSFILS